MGHEPGRARRLGEGPAVAVAPAGRPRDGPPRVRFTASIETSSPEPVVTTREFWASGEANRILIGAIDTRVPVWLVHGQMDFAVSWQRTMRLAELLRSSDVQIHLIKDGDHRLSRDADIALLLDAVGALAEWSDR